MWECWQLPNETATDEDGLGFLGAILGIATGVLGLIGAAKSGPSSKQLAQQRAQIEENERLKKSNIESLSKIAQGSTIAQNIKYISKKNPELLAVGAVAILFFLTSGGTDRK